MNTDAFKVIALDWIEAWNGRDIDRIMDHYADDVIFYGPTVITRWDIPDGKLVGKDQLRKHFHKGLDLAPDLCFKLITVLNGTDGMTILYKRESGIIVADVATLNEACKKQLVKVYQEQK